MIFTIRSIISAARSIEMDSFAHFALPRQADHKRGSADERDESKQAISFDVNRRKLNIKCSHREKAKRDDVQPKCIHL